MKELLTRQDLYGLLGCSLPTVKRLLKRGELPVIRVGKRMLARKEAVERWLQAHETPATGCADAGEPEMLATPDRLAQALEVTRSPQAQLPREDRAEAEDA
jgi:excisionase family DNA binding protein